METLWIILLAAPFLLIAALAFLALIVTGIRRADRCSLRQGARGQVDSMTRRVIGLGVRDSASDDESR